VLAALVRSGLVEATHEGAVAVVAADGTFLASSGDVDRPFFIRSAAKPFQAAACLRLGFDPPAEHLALACGSHPGEPVHVAIAEAMLASAGLTADALRCPADWPLSHDATHRLVAAGRTRSPVFHNCSGKHASWLATSVLNGWDLASYLDPSHPVQRAIFDLMSEAGAALLPAGIDGCGAPVYRTSVRMLAAAFASLGTNDGWRRVFEVMSAYPALTGQELGADRLITTWLDAVAKGGAMGCIGISTRDGIGVAAKCWDGSDQAAGVGALGALQQLGRVPESVTRHLEPVARPPVFGAAAVVGALESRLELQWA
jgi:L-asparaginase II